MVRIAVLLIILLTTTGCGINGHVDPITVNPIEVKHEFSINFESVFNYCKNQCAGVSLDPLLLQDCSTKCYNNFVAILANSLNGISGGKE